MASLLRILAASVGGGLVLGASIRLGEAIGANAGRQSGDDAGTPPFEDLPPPANRRQHKVSERAAAHSEFESPVEWQAILEGIGARIDRQQAELEAIRRQSAKAASSAPPDGEVTRVLREEMHRQLSQDLDQRVAAIEENLRRDMRAAQQHTVDAMTTALETRIAPRISRLENDVNGQFAAVTELRECSMQTERSIQKLLTVLDRLLNKGPEGESPRLSVVSGRAQDESGMGGDPGARRSSAR